VEHPIFCLQHGKGVEIDLTGAAHYFQIAAHRAIAAAEINSGCCLDDDQNISNDLEGAIHSFKLSAAQHNSVICLQDIRYVSIDFNRSAYCHALAADHDFAESQYHLI
jgi:TPR repeat protein